MAENLKETILNIAEILSDVQTVARGMSGTMDAFYLNDIIIDRDKLFMFLNSIKYMTENLEGAEDKLEMLARTLVGPTSA